MVLVWFLHEGPPFSHSILYSFLKANKISFKGGYAKTGIVATIKGKNPNKKTIALRADIDALPIKETNKVKYKSKNEGVMHACGHDVHTASLLGCAIILNQCKQDFEGTVRCIFQPGEELLPGGASLLIKDGVLKNPKPRSIIGQHVHPPLKVGKVGFKSGMYMASADEIYVTVKGKGGHAALPEAVIDPILIASNLIVSLQQIVSRKAPPSIPTVLSFGKIKHRLDIPGQEDVELRNALVERFENGDGIKMDYKDGRVEFDSGEEQLDRRLDNMQQYDAIALARLHNQAINNSRAGLPVLLGDYGDEVDEFLRKRRRLSRRKGQRAGWRM